MPDNRESHADRKKTQVARYPGRKGRRWAPLRQALLRRPGVTMGLRTPGGGACCRVAVAGEHRGTPASHLVVVRRTSDARRHRGVPGAPYVRTRFVPPAVQAGQPQAGRRLVLSRRLLRGVRLPVAESKRSSGATGRAVRRQLQHVPDRLCREQAAPISSPTMDAFSPFFKDGHGRRLLDFGCGAGLFLELAESLGFEVAGTDLSHDSLDLARRRIKSRALHVGSPADVPELATGGFDIVTMWSVLAHLPRPKGGLAMPARAAQRHWSPADSDRECRVADAEGLRVELERVHREPPDVLLPAHLAQVASRCWIRRRRLCAVLRRHCRVRHHKDVAAQPGAVPARRRCDQRGQHAPRPRVRFTRGCSRIWAESQTAGIGSEQWGASDPHWLARRQGGLRV